MSGVYVAIAPCGCVAACDTEDGPETHAQIAVWIKRGLRVHHWPDARTVTFGCQHKPQWGRQA